MPRALVTFDDASAGKGTEQLDNSCSCTCGEFDTALSTRVSRCLAAWSLLFLRRSRVLFDGRIDLDFSSRCLSRWQYVHNKPFVQLACLQKRHGWQALSSCLRAPIEESSPLEFRGTFSKMPSLWSSSNFSMGIQVCSAKVVSSIFLMGANPLSPPLLLHDSIVVCSQLLSCSVCCSLLCISSCLSRMMSSADRDWGGDASETSLSMRASGSDQCLGPGFPYWKTGSACLLAPLPWS